MQTRLVILLLLGLIESYAASCDAMHRFGIPQLFKRAHGGEINFWEHDCAIDEYCEFCAINMRVVDTMLYRTSIDAVIGSSNQLSRRIETDGWVVIADARHTVQEINGKRNNFSLDFRKIYHDSWEPIFCSAKSPQLQFYNNSVEEQVLILKETNKELYALFLSALSTRYYRSGNCSAKSDLLAYHLIKSGVKTINRVEIFRFKEKVSHRFVVVNRKLNSKVTDSRDWGSAAIIADPWLERDKDLRRYRAEEISEKLQAVYDRLCYEDKRIEFPSHYSQSGPKEFVDNDGVRHSVNSFHSFGYDQSYKIAAASLPLEVVLDIDPNTVRSKLPDLDLVTIRVTDDDDEGDNGRFRKVMKQFEDEV